MNTKTGFTRRQFIKSNVLAALAAATFPTIIPSSALGKDGAVAPSERIVVGAIGVGERGRSVLGNFTRLKQCQVVAVCDVKQSALGKAKEMVDKNYGNTDCQVLSDYRQLAARKDIDAVLIASTDHWHVLHALAAVRGGKDVYLEKPLGMSLGEDKALRDEVLKHKRIFQFGTQQRSSGNFRLACELVRSGAIGKLKHINIWSPASSSGAATKVTPPPAGLDYNFWLGPAPHREHTENLTVNTTWWFVSDFALGFIAGWGIHPLDIALWGAGDLATGGVDVAGQGTFPTEGLSDTATAWNIDLNFASGLTMKFTSPPGKSGLTRELEREWTDRYGKLADHGTVFEGENGWIRVERGNIETQPENLTELDASRFSTRLVRSDDHVLNFLESVKTRQAAVSPIESAVQSDALCHVSDIAIRFKRKLRYDDKAEQIVNDKAADQRLQFRPMRKPWRI